MRGDRKDPRERMLSLDVFRGITVAMMIMVNNPGTWSYIYPPLRHAEWNGLTPTDLVFPFFMFIMGVSSYLSLSKYDFRLSLVSGWKILRRTLVIFLIGIAVAWLSLFLRGVASETSLVDAALNFDRIRILGVLPRLAISYGIAVLIALSCGVKRLPAVVVGLLVAYAVILVAGHGWEFTENNVIAVVDRAVLGEAHMYTDYVGGESLKFDPEGLLSTLPSVAHVLIGFLAGLMIFRSTDAIQRTVSLFVLGTTLAFAGFLLDYALPINKKIWSPTFVLTTCGLASLLFGLLCYVIDVRRRSRWCGFFEVFGANPLALYVLASLISIFTGFVRLPSLGSSDGFSTLHGLIFQGFVVPLCGEQMFFASLVYSLLIVVTVWLAGFVLYKRKI